MSPIPVEPPTHDEDAPLLPSPYGPADTGPQDDERGAPALAGLLLPTIADSRVVANALELRSHYFGPAHCLQFSRTAAEAPGGVYDADASWFGPGETFQGVPPPGSMIYWRVGSHGHVAVSLGLGRCVSTDVYRSGYADICQMSKIAYDWGAELRGYKWRINGTLIEHADTTREWFEDMNDADRAEVRAVMDNALKDALTADNPALLNAVRVAIEAERAEDAAAVWASPLVNPLTGEQQKAGTFLRFGTQRLERLRIVGEAVASKLGVKLPT